MNQNEKLKVVVIELLDSLANDLAEFLFDKVGWDPFIHLIAIQIREKL